MWQNPPCLPRTSQHKTGAIMPCCAAKQWAEARASLFSHGFVHAGLCCKLQPRPSSILCLLVAGGSPHMHVRWWPVQRSDQLASAGLAKPTLSTIRLRLLPQGHPTDQPTGQRVGLGISALSPTPHGLLRLQQTPSQDSEPILLPLLLHLVDCLYFFVSSTCFPHISHTPAHSGGRPWRQGVSRSSVQLAEQ